LYRLFFYQINVLLGTLVVVEGKIQLFKENALSSRHLVSFELGLYCVNCRAVVILFECEHPNGLPSHASRGSGLIWVREELKARGVGRSTAERKTTAPAPRARSAAEGPTVAGSAAPSPL
jgi:hypothetical protein